jgi:formylglycine-generating enzyme required for sulfatase activity
MGCVDGRDKLFGVGCDWIETQYEVPSHTVSLTRSFFIMKTEVTNTMWDSIMEYDTNDEPGGSSHPVETVRWVEALYFANKVSESEGLEPCYILSDCTEFATSLMNCDVAVNTPNENPMDCEGYRLPTEAEWEYAARGGLETQYPGGGTCEQVAVSYSNSLDPTGDPQSRWTPHISSPVCSKTLNSWLLCDMAGNLEELIWDGMRVYTSGIHIDPMGPPVVNSEDLGYSNVRTRGGSYQTTGCNPVVDDLQEQDNGLRNSSRGMPGNYGGPDDTAWQQGKGFRLVRTSQ